MIICKQNSDILTRIDIISQKNGDIYSSFKIKKALSLFKPTIHCELSIVNKRGRNLKSF